MSVTRDQFKGLRTCQMLIGDATGPQGRCFALAEMPVRLGTMKIQACRHHASQFKEAREHQMQQAQKEACPSAAE